MRFLLSVVLYGIISIGMACNIVVKKNSKNSTKINYERVYPIDSLLPFEDTPFLFYNVENLFDTIDDPHKNDNDFLPFSKKEWNTERYTKKLNDLATVIAASGKKNPVFFGLAEIENRAVVEDLAISGRLAETNYHVSHFDSPDNRGIDVALVYDAQRFHLLYEATIPIKIINEPKFATRDILYVKGALKDSIVLHLFVNHWPSRLGGTAKSEYKRIYAAQLLQKKVDSIQKTDASANIIITGDFNDYPHNNSVSKILNAKKYTEVSDKKDLVNLMIPLKEKGLGSYNYRGKWDFLDQFIVSPNLITTDKGLKIRGNTAFLVDDDEFMFFFENGEKTPNKTYGQKDYFGGYSDHLAVYGYLKVVK